MKSGLLEGNKNFLVIETSKEGARIAIEKVVGSIPWLACWEIVRRRRSILSPRGRGSEV